MASSKQNDLSAFFSPRKFNLKIPINSGLRQGGTARPRKMALWHLSIIAALLLQHCFVALMHHIYCDCTCMQYPRGRFDPKDFKLEGR
jgi:hypothetical protein